MRFDPARFVHPKILFDEIRIAGGGGPPTELSSAALTAPRDMIVDFIGFSEETFSDGLGAANDTYLQYIDVNWRIGERPLWRAQDLHRVVDLHNLYGDRSCDPCAVDLAGWGSFRWNFAMPWIMNPYDGFSVDWTNIAAAVQIPRLICPTLHGVGVKSGTKRAIQTLTLLTVPPIGIATVTNTTNDPINGANHSDEPFRIDSLTIAFPGNSSSNTDRRILNHHRIRIIPSVGGDWSEPRVPLIFYSPHAGLPNRVAWHKPVGGPLYMRAGQRITFTIRNNAAINQCNMQVACLGRTAPEYEGVQ